ncbi:MAG: response regulator [Candidatus Riflebacteria bacterium]|nr:response regulator [Candidatus Riflebacteria bacterium]
MTSNDNHLKQAVQLRRRAEESLLKNGSISSTDLEQFSQEKVKCVLHELSVHQIELEMQNEELRNIRKELEVSRARYFDLFNQAPVGYVSLNEDGLILESNLTAASLLGVPVGELQNKLLSNYIFFEDQDIFYHHRKNIFISGLPQECELRMKRSETTSCQVVFWARLESSAANHALASKELPGSNSRNFRLVISDITGNRTLAEQLHHAQKMETIGLLAGGVAHDYNNKLAVIIGYAELALNKEVSPQTNRNFFEEILTAAQQSAAITRQLLTIARKQMVSPAVIDLNQAVESMLKMLRHVVGEEIELVWKPESDLCPVEIDPVQIDQILLNLCLNAKSAITGNGRVTIATKNATFDTSFCKLHTGHIEGKFVMIEVVDTGCGMAAEILAKIFEPFFTTRGIGQGTGLGLSAVDGIVKQNNGFIVVASEPGNGATFKIYLPAYSGTVIDRHWEDRKEMMPGSGETVLVVENEAALLPVIKIMLEKLGFRVLTANSAGAAAELAEKHEQKIDLLVTDVIMPEMNGCEVLELVQKTNPDIKTLFMSGHPANVLIRRGFTGSNLNFLQKPFSMNDLAEKIGKLTL